MYFDFFFPLNTQHYVYHKHTNAQAHNKIIGVLRSQSSLSFTTFWLFHLKGRPLLSMCCLRLQVHHIIHKMKQWDAAANGNFRKCSGQGLSLQHLLLKTFFFSFLCSLQESTLCSPWGKCAPLLNYTSSSSSSCVCLTGEYFTSYFWIFS